MTEAAARAATAARRAEALGSTMPPLLVAAERVAATVAQGVHGRRRVGQGDSFWQFRPFTQGDAAMRIDWRQSGKSDRAFVRETEWEAAQTVCLWHDRSPSMHWKSRGVATQKQERAALLVLALASLMLRGGERVVMMEPGSRAVAGRLGLERLAQQMDQTATAPDTGGLPPAMKLPRNARVVLFSDFYSPLEAVRSAVAALASIPVTGTLFQIVDPAEVKLPYVGRVRFEGLEREDDALIPRVERVRDDYAARFAAHQAGLADLGVATGFRFFVHRTDQSPESALLSLYANLADAGARTQAARGAVDGFV